MTPKCRARLNARPAQAETSQSHGNCLARSTGFEIASIQASPLGPFLIRDVSDRKPECRPPTAAPDRQISKYRSIYLR